MRIFFLGRSEFLYDTIIEASKKYNVVGIVTGKSMPEYSKKESDFEQLASDIGCNFMVAKKIDEDVLNLVMASKAEVCITFNWLSLIEENFTKLFNGKVFNCHFADLPSYKGNAVINWAILRGESEIGVTVHVVEPSMLDSGDIALKNKIDLTHLDNIEDLIESLRMMVPRMFLSLLEGLEKKNFLCRPQSQEGTEGFRCFPRIPSYSKINWHENNVSILRLIKSSSHPYSGAYGYLMLNGRMEKLTIWSAKKSNKYNLDVYYPGHILELNKITGSVVVGTGDGAIEVLKCSIGNDKKNVSPINVIKSIRTGFIHDLEGYVISLERRLEKLEALLNQGPAGE